MFDLQFFLRFIMLRCGNRSGITHGRGLSEEQRLLWLNSRPAFAHLKSEFDKLYKEDDKYINKKLINNRIKGLIR